MTVPHDEPHTRGDTGTSESTRLPMDDGDLHVCQDGPRDAPALLLIHGSASSGRWWDQLVPMLTNSHHVIRIDLLGHGRSAKPTNCSYQIPDQARRVGTALDRLRVKRAIVVGHSSGGAVATALAEQRPDLVTALTLINTGPSLDAYRAPETAAVAPSQWPPTEEQIRQFTHTGVSRPGYQIPPHPLSDVRTMTHHTLTTTMQGTSDYLEQRTLPERLRVLGKPLLVLFGEDDQRWRSSSATDYHTVPEANVILLPGLGHTPILEDPPQTATSLLAFTTTHTPQED